LRRVNRYTGNFQGGEDEFLLIKEKKNCSLKRELKKKARIERGGKDQRYVQKD